MANLKVVIGTDHVGTHYAEELRDSFPEIDFIVAYDPADHVEAIHEADAFFGWPTGEAFAAALKQDAVKFIALADVFGEMAT